MKTRNFILAFKLCLFCLYSFSQDFYWAKQFESGISYNNSIAIDDSGNVYTTGFFFGTVDFDAGENTSELFCSGYGCNFICKLSPEGNFIWAKKFDGNSIYDFCSGESIVIDDSCNVYTIGKFSGTFDFDPNESVYYMNAISGSGGGHGDVFISKLNSSGNFVWAKQFGGVNETNGNSIALDNSGNIYTTGEFSDTVDFDPGAGIYNLINPSYYNGLCCSSGAFISKLTNDGDFIWAKQLEGLDGSIRTSSITISDSGYVYTTGVFGGTVDFNPSLDTFKLEENDASLFINKLDKFGNFIWTKGSNSPSYGRCYSNSIVIDNNGNVLTTGYFEGIVDFDFGDGEVYLDAYISENTFISKIDPSGNYFWVKQFESSYTNSNPDFQSCTSNSIALDQFGNIYTVGFFSFWRDFDPGEGVYNLIISTLSSNVNGYISKLDTSGNFVWAKYFYDDFGASINEAIAVDELGNVYTTGEFQFTIDFDPGVDTFYLSSSNASGFVHKMSQNAVGINEYNNDSFFFVYPNPSSNEVTIEYSLNSLKNISFSIYDIRGRLIKKIEKGNKPAGKYVLEKVDISKLANGIYFVQMQTDKESIVKKLLKE